MDKDKIIQAYKKAKTATELKEAKDKYYKDYGKFLSWDLTQIKEVYKKRMENLK